jgi:putative transposase
MKRVVKLRAYLTPKQQAKAIQCNKTHCELYNAALEERKEHYKRHGERYNVTSQSAQLKYIREERPELAEYSFTSQQQTLRKLQTSFEAFFKRVDRGQKPGYPRYKSAKTYDTTYHVNGDGAKWKPNPNQKYGTCYIKGIGDIECNQHRCPVGKVTRIALVRDYNRWYICLTEEIDVEPLPKTGCSIGIDLGAAKKGDSKVKFATLSDGTEICSPNFSKKHIDTMVSVRDKMTYGKKRNDLSRKIRKTYRKLVNQRNDFQHKLAFDLVQKNDVIVVEKLNISKMLQNDKPSWLHEVISNVAWGSFVLILEGKAEKADREIVKVNPAHTSVTCSICGVRGVRVSQEVFECLSCGLLPADFNAAVNISVRGGLAPTTQVGNCSL